MLESWKKNNNNEFVAMAVTRWRDLTNSFVMNDIIQIIEYGVVIMLKLIGDVLFSASVDTEHINFESTCNQRHSFIPL